MGYCFFLLLFSAAARIVRQKETVQVMMELFWDIKNLSSCCFLVAVKFFSHFIGKCQCKYAVRLEMKSREEN